MIIDAAFILLMAFAAFKGLRKGLIVAIFSFVAFIAGLAAALKLSAVVAERMADHINPSRWLPFIAFIIVFLLVVFMISIGGRLIQKAFETVMLGWINRLGGAALYMALYTFIFSIFLFYIVQINFIRPETISDSFFYKYLEPLGPAVINKIGDVIPFFKDMFSQLQEFFGGLSNKVEH